MNISEEEEACKFTWQIENFYMCPQTRNNCIFGPKFVVDFLQKTKFMLDIFPRGSDKEEYVACGLLRESEEDSKDDITIDISFTVTSSHSGKNATINYNNVTFTEQTHKRFDIISREELFKEENGLLPHGNLTLVCHVRKNNGKHDTITERSLTYSDCKSINNDCMVVTTIETHLMSLLWVIEDQSLLRPKQKVKNIVELTTTEILSLELQLCVMGEHNVDQCVQIEVLKSRESKQSYDFFLRGIIKTLGSPKEIQHEGRSEYFFDCGVSDSVWKFPTFIKMTDIKKENYLHYTNGDLYLYCESTVTPNTYMYDEEYKCKSKNGDTKEQNCQCSLISTPMFRAESNHFIRSGEVFRKLYRDGTFSDVTIRARNHLFSVHKAILATGSEVFKDIIETDESVKQCGIVDIVDFDPDTVNRFLLFMYSEVLEDLTEGAAMSVYSAAVTYKAVLLRCRCCCILMSLLSVSNVCNILRLGVINQDDDLCRAVLNFLRLRSDRIFQSQTWKEFAEKHSTISSNVMLSILSNSNCLSHK